MREDGISGLEVVLALLYVCVVTPISIIYYALYEWLNA